MGQDDSLRSAQHAWGSLKAAKVCSASITSPLMVLTRIQDVSINIVYDATVLRIWKARLAHGVRVPKQMISDVASS